MIKQTKKLQLPSPSAITHKTNNSGTGAGANPVQSSNPNTISNTNQNTQQNITSNNNSNSNNNQSIKSNNSKHAKPPSSTTPPVNQIQQLKQQISKQRHKNELIRKDIAAQQLQWSGKIDQTKSDILLLKKQYSELEKDIADIQKEWEQLEASQNKEDEKSLDKNANKEQNEEKTNE